VTLSVYARSVTQAGVFEARHLFKLSAASDPQLRPDGATVAYAERSGWGHLYLIDLKTGATKRAITSGEWLVRYWHRAT
jgi:Tol biopolymer transport system component